jgi:hypothetical protein
MGMSLSDLLSAGIGGDDGIEVWRQSERSLTVPGGAIPRQIVTGRKRVQVAEEVFGILRAVRLVILRSVGEVIVESHFRLPVSSW